MVGFLHSACVPSIDSLGLPSCAIPGRIEQKMCVRRGQHGATR